MLKLYENLLDTLSSGKNCILVATVEAKGSSPRSAGAYMLVDDTGRLYGTIGGGELEYRATFKARELLDKDEAALIEYDLSNETAAGLGMICGGRAKVLYHVFRPEDADFAAAALELARSRKPYHLLLPLNGGKALLETGLDAPKRQFGYLHQAAEYYLEQFNFDGKVFLLGGGHLSQELVPLLSHLGFCCIVGDDRPEFTRPELFPGADAVHLVDFTGLSLPIGPEDYLVIATRGHLADIDCIRFALKTPAKYIGVVGSRRKVVFIREKMLSEGFTESDLKRLTTPIGIDIGSETPAEIAVSIAAQLIQIRSEQPK